MWCESSQKPTTYGFGKQAADMLSVAGRLADMTRIVQTIKTLHAAIATSAAPLQVRLVTGCRVNSSSHDNILPLKVYRKGVSWLIC